MISFALGDKGGLHKYLKYMIQSLIMGKKKKNLKQTKKPAPG